MKTLGKNQKEILEIKKKKVTKTKNAFDGFILRLGTAKERISQLKDSLTELTKPKCKKKRMKKKKKNRIEHPRSVGQFQNM